MAGRRVRAARQLRACVDASVTAASDPELIRWVSMRSLLLTGLVIVITLGVIAVLRARRQLGRFEARTRIPVLPATPVGDTWLAAIPARIVAVDHRPRERGGCSCEAVAFADRVGRQRAMLTVSASSLAAWRGRRADVHLTHRIGLSRLRAVTVLQHAYGLLSRSHYTTNVDNLPIPGGLRHRLRMIFADRSSIVVTIAGIHNARLFVETFAGLRDDVQLRILGALAGREGLTVDALAEEVDLSASELGSPLAKLVDAGLVRRGPTSVELTDVGRAALAAQARYVVTMARFVQVDDVQADYTGG